MQRIMKRVISGCLFLGLLVSCFFTVSAEEPNSAPYEVGDVISCTGYTEFSNPIIFQSGTSSKCFLIDLNGIKRYTAVSESQYPYFEKAFTGKPMTFEGTYAGMTSEGVPVVKPVTLIEGEQKTDLVTYLWELNKGSMDNLNFTAYKDLYDATFVTVSEDGSYLEFDSNQYNLDGDSFLVKILTESAVEDLQEMNKLFGLPDWLYEEMTSTRALDGRQKEVFDYLTVTWSYHPDQGLEAIYRKN